MEWIVRKTIKLEKVVQATNRAEAISIVRDAGEHTMSIRSFKESARKISPARGKVGKKEGNDGK